MAKPGIERAGITREDSSGILGFTRGLGSSEVSFMRKSAVFGSFVLAAVSACSGSNSGGNGSVGGDVSVGGSSTPASTVNGGGGVTSAGGAQTGGVANAGTGGINPGTGGMSPGTGGMSPGTGGISPGTGGINPGTGGMSPGTGGMNPGTGGIGTGTGGRTGTGGSSSGIGGTTAGNTGGSSTTSTGGKSSTGGTGAATTGGNLSTGGVGTGGSTGTTTGCVVNLASTHQTIQGFGINDTWQPSAFSSTVADQLFTTTSGIGLTILRVGMNDTSTTGAFYNSYEATNISSVKSRAGTDAKIIGSVWSPPANCKTNNNVNNGGHLCSSTNSAGSQCTSNAASTCYDSFSTTIANFAKNNGLYAMSIGNEPDFASCGTADPCNGNYPTTLYTANELVAWVKVAGPKLKAQGIKVIAPEASEWIHNWSNISAGPDPGGQNSSDPLKCGCFGMTIAGNTATCSSTCTSGGGYDYGHYLAADSAAWAAFDIMGVHEYDSQRAEPWPSDVTAARKEVWQTEMSGVKWWPEVGPSATIDNGVAVAGWIHSALAVGDASAWLWWWYAPLSGGTNDNEGLVLQGSTAWTKRYYTLGNYSKFVRPGYVRVDVTGNSNANVLLSAFKGTDGTVVIVAINKGTSSVTLPISISGGTVPANMTPTVTSSADNLAAKTAVPVSGGSFTATLAAATVTTFVGK
jgi:glucuronoarabinoxylan endo-1,4-beta-xylanase